MRIFTVVLAAAVSLCATTAPAQAAGGVGEAMEVIDKASASGQVGERKLAVGSKVFVGDTVTTDANGRVQLRFGDGTRMIVGSDSTLVIDELRFGGNADKNRFAVYAVAGRFRFISGDSGDRGYSIRTPSARIDVRGTAFDFTVTPEGETKLLMLQGEAKLCPEDGEDDDCVTAATPCALLQTDSDEGVEEIEAGNRRVRETRKHFPHLQSDATLLEEFRVAGHGCIAGGLSEFVLDSQAIRKAVGFGLGTVLIGFGVCLLADGCLESGPTTNATTTIGTNNGTN